MTDTEAMGAIVLVRRWGTAAVRDGLVPIALVALAPPPAPTAVHVYIGDLPDSDAQIATILEDAARSVRAGHASTVGVAEGR